MVSPGHTVEGLGFPVSLQGPTLFLDLARLCGGKKKAIEVQELKCRQRAHTRNMNVAPRP